MSMLGDRPNIYIYILEIIKSPFCKNLVLVLFFILRALIIIIKKLCFGLGLLNIISKGFFYKKKLD